MAQLATLDDIASIDPPSPNVARLEDVARIEPPAAGIATLADVASIAPPLYEPQPSPVVAAAARPAPHATGFTDLASVHVTEPPPPVQAVGFTDPASVRVTNPAAAALPVQPRPPLSGATQGGEPVYGGPMPLGTVPVLDAPALGIPQALRGVSALVRGAVTPAPANVPDARIPRGRYTGLLGAPTSVPDVTKNAVSDVVEGTFKTLEPAIAGSAIAAPVQTAAALAEAMLASKAGEKATELVGGSPASQRLAGNVAATVGAGHGSERLMDRLRRRDTVNHGFTESVNATHEAAAEAPTAPQVAHVDDIVSVEPPAEPIAPQVGHVEDIVQIEPPADAAPVAPHEDVLDTGERQGRLPGDAGAVRDAQVPTPAVAEAPFSLEPETATRTAVQPTLPEEPHAEVQGSDEGPAVAEPAPPPEAPPDAAGAPPVPETPAAAVVTPPKRPPRGVRADEAPADTITAPERRQLRRILADMEDYPLEKKRFLEQVGQGSTKEISGGAAGAPVYWDIVGGNPEGKPRFGYSRGAVTEKLRAFLEQGTRSVVSDLAVDVARRHLAGEHDMQPLWSHPDAGNEPGRIPVNRLPRLDPRRMAVQETAARLIESTPDEQLVRQYRERFGNVINADNAKELLPGYATPAERTANDLALHRPAAALAQRVYEHAIEAPVDAAHDRFVAMTMGGTGSGKSTGLAALLPADAQSRAQAIFDSVGTNVDAMKRNIGRARSRDLEALVVLNDADVVDAFRGMLDRARDTGRPVTLNTHVASHLGAPTAFEELRAAYAHDPGVVFYVSRRLADGGRELVPLEEWQPRSYNEPDVRSSLSAVLDEERAAGRLPDDLADAIRPTLTPAVPADAVRSQDATAGENREADARGDRSIQRDGDAAAGRPDAEPAAEKVDPAAEFIGRYSPEAYQQLAGLFRNAKLEQPPFEDVRDGYAQYLRDTVPADREQTVQDFAVALAEGKPGASVALRRARAGTSDEPLSRPLGSRRADASGALTPAPGSRTLAGLTGATRKQLRPSEIVREVSAHLDALPVRVGKFKQHALGIYKPREQTIRLKVANDLDTFAHELGHHVHETVMGVAIDPKAYKGELLKLGAVTSRGSYSQKQILQEGQAEFTRYYLGDPATAQKLAPTYYAAFETALAKQPALEAILQRAQRQYVGFLSQDPVTRGVARIDFDGIDLRPKGDILTRLETAWVDDLAPLRRATQQLAEGQPVNAAADAYVLARLARGASAKADGFLRYGVRDTDGTFVAGALEPALRPVRDQMKEFAAYLVASRAVELRHRGMETGMTLAEAQAIRQRYKSPEFDTAAQAVYDYQDGVLEYGKRSGYLSQDQIDQMKKANQFYVPFQRVLDDVGAVAGGGGRGLANTPSAIKRIKGSGRDIINPVESIVKNTHAFVGLVEQNKAMLALVDQAHHTTGGGRFIERIPEKLIGTSFNLEQVSKAIRQRLDDYGVEVPDNLDFDKFVTVFTPNTLRLGERGVVSVLRKGTREWYSVNEPTLFDALAAAPPKATNLVYEILAKPARLLRAGATTTLGFIARNPIRDTFEATVNSRYGFRPGYDTLRGLFAYLQKGDDYQQFLNSGAGNSALVAADRNRVREELQHLGIAGRRRILDSTVLHPVQLLQAMSEAMEQATRLGEFKRGIDTEGRTAEGFTRAALAARDVTIDFARGGAESKTINRYTAFFNAGVQGNVRLAEVFRRDPIGATLKAAATITLPSIALWTLNQDDPEYHELPAWERNTYWHIPIGRGTGHGWARVPKPFSLGQVFGNTTEAALDYVTQKDPAAVTRVLPDKDTAWRQLTGLMMNAFMPIIEVGTNYDTFRDRAIVNPYDLGLDTQLQYNRWTSELAKVVGPKIGLAPAKLDHLIYGYGGGLAKGVTQAADPLLGGKDRPSGGAAGWPLVGAFYRDAPRTDAASLERFYALRDELAGATGSIRRYLKAGEQPRASDRLQQASRDVGGDLPLVRARVKAADQALTELRDGVNEVFASRSLSSEQKRATLDRLYEQMLQTARAGLGERPLPARAAASGPPKASVPVAPADKR